MLAYITGWQPSEINAMELDELNEYINEAVALHNRINSSEG